MNKQDTLDSIRNAVNAHKIQMEKIKKAIDGYSVENPTAVKKTECDFGIWIYDKDSNLRNILGSLFYDKIESFHTQWHDEYMNLYQVLFKKEDKGFFAKFITPKVDEMELDKAKLYYSEILLTTSELLKALAIAERRIEALQESKFI